MKNVLGTESVSRFQKLLAKTKSLLSRKKNMIDGYKKRLDEEQIKDLKGGAKVMGLFPVA